MFVRGKCYLIVPGVDLSDLKVTLEVDVTVNELVDNNEERVGAGTHLKRNR